MDAVSSHEEIYLDLEAVAESRVNLVVKLGKVGQPMAYVYAFGRYSSEQRRDEVRAMRLVVREAEGIEHRVAERCAKKSPSVVPAALVPRERTHAHRGELVREADAVEYPRRVRADLNPGADLADLGSSLIEVHVEAPLGAVRALPPMPPPMTATEVRLTSGRDTKTF